MHGPLFIPEGLSDKRRDRLFPQDRAHEHNSTGLVGECAEACDRGDQRVTSLETYRSSIGLQYNSLKPQNGDGGALYSVMHVITQLCHKRS